MLNLNGYFDIAVVFAISVCCMVEIILYFNDL